jgi:hypothetical protein
MAFYPAIEWIRSHERRWLRGELIAGAVAAATENLDEAMEAQIGRERRQPCRPVISLRWGGQCFCGASRPP